MHTNASGNFKYRIATLSGLVTRGFTSAQTQTSNTVQTRTF